MSERLQEIYDTVKDHLLKQNKKSFGDYFNKSEGEFLDGCLYRSAEGLKCAAGCLIPDDKYDSSIEGCTPSFVQYLVDTYTVDELKLIADLQFVHDWSSVENWPSELDKLANKYLLNT